MSDKKSKKGSLFPKNFVWGASTASHQVEGHTHNQWTVWELENAKELAKKANDRLSWIPGWERFRAAAEVPENYISGAGVEHYKLHEKDFDIAEKLNLNSLRFGIEWSRVEPEEGVWDAEAISHYVDYIHELIERNIDPVVNFWHWTMPVWFTDKGGFANKKNIHYFERFIEKMCAELPLQNVHYVITLNEPNVYASFGYMTGEWPPNQKNMLTFLRVYYNLTIAHKRSYRILKKRFPHVHIGVAAQLANIQAKRPQNFLDNMAVRWMRYFWNWWFLNRIKKYQDYVGFNYYFTDYYRFGSLREMLKGKIFYRDNPHAPTNDLGWYMEPEGLHALIVRVWAHYKKPMLITENGLADKFDEHRRWWIEETIVALERALSEGADVRGYFHWSLLDNFEWAYGWWPEFGLVHVDRSTMKRTVRPSAYYYAGEIRKNS